MIILESGVRTNQFAGPYHPENALEHGVSLDNIAFENFCFFLLQLKKNVGQIGVNIHFGYILLSNYNYNYLPKLFVLLSFPSQMRSCGEHSAGASNAD